MRLWKWIKNFKLHYVWFRKREKKDKKNVQEWHILITSIKQPPILKCLNIVPRFAEVKFFKKRRKGDIFPQWSFSSKQYVFLFNKPAKFGNLSS